MLTAVEQARDVLASARSDFEIAIRTAVKAGASKTEVAEAAGISRPTLYRILNERNP